ncbi:hypothetical protein PPYR_00011 [Photinus pyralis]|uniref:Uncharacterized protein n=1 Tax=Photinus pyralis TaxID=7054 RepID=A0A5N4B0A1_PHOPY|nr:hypothetical protein PPYR_00011 [Photinus pyralis]
MLPPHSRRGYARLCESESVSSALVSSRPSLALLACSPFLVGFSNQRKRGARRAHWCYSVLKRIEPEKTTRAIGESVEVLAVPRLAKCLAETFVESSRRECGGSITVLSYYSNYYSSFPLYFENQFKVTRVS